MMTSLTKRRGTGHAIEFPSRTMNSLSRKTGVRTIQTPILSHPEKIGSMKTRTARTPKEGENRVVVLTSEFEKAKIQVEELDQEMDRR